MGRFEFLDFLKGFLIFLVTIGHAIQFVAYQNTDFWSDPVFKAIYIFHMPLFMAVAGYVSYSGLSKSKNIMLYVRLRLQTYLIPVFVWAAMFQTALFIMKSHLSITDLPVSIINEALTSLWFIWALLGAIIVTALAQSAGRYRNLFFIVLFVMILYLPDVYNIHLFKYTLPFFIIGFLASSMHFKGIGSKLEYPLIMILGCFSFLCFIIWDNETYIYISKMELSLDNAFNVIFRWLSGAIVSVFVVMLLYKVYCVIPLKIKTMVSSVGKDSLYIYIIQGYLFMVIGKFFTKIYYLGGNNFFEYLAILIIGVVVALISWGGGHVLSKNKFIAKCLFGKVVV